ncbi:MAG: hypothetical protein ACFN1H_06730, partial [Propionibacterium freudenreichii]
AVLGLVACVPGILLGMVAAQPFASVLTRLAAARMGRIEFAQTRPSSRVRAFRSPFTRRW